VQLAVALSAPWASPITHTNIVSIFAITQVIFEQAATDFRLRDADFRGLIRRGSTVYYPDGRQHVHVCSARVSPGARFRERTLCEKPDETPQNERYDESPNSAPECSADVSWRWA
jgi:hypothetical protein